MIFLNNPLQGELANEAPRHPLSKQKKKRRKPKRPKQLKSPKQTTLKKQLLNWKTSKKTLNTERLKKKHSQNYTIKQ
jgi:predicted RNA-binding protein with RPS1 domain